MIFNWISPPNCKPHNMAYAIPWGKNYKIIYAHFLILNSILLTWSWWRISFVNIRNDSVNTANLNEIFSRKCETEKYGRYIKALERTQESDSRVTICWLGKKKYKGYLDPIRNQHLCNSLEMIWRDFDAKVSSCLTWELSPLQFLPSLPGPTHTNQTYLCIFSWQHFNVTF